MYSEDPVIERIIAAYRARKPLFLLGPPGYAKTDRVHQASAIIGAHPEWWEHLDDGAGWQGNIVRRLAQMVDATEFIGMPDIEANGGEQRYTVWRFPKSLPRHGCGILFLDEFNLADPSLQAVSRQLIDSFRIGLCEYELPRGFSIVGAGNRAEDGTPVYEVDKAMERRWIWYDVPKPTVAGWTEWAIARQVHPDVIAYLNYEWASAFDPAYPNVGQIKETPYANLPSWVAVSDLIKAQGSGIDTDTMGDLAKMCVGSIALRFQGFVMLRGKLVDPKEAMARPDITPLPSYDRLDQRWSLTSALASYVGTTLTEMFVPSDESETDKIKRAVTQIAHPTCILIKRLGPEMGLLLMKMAKANTYPQEVFLKVFSREPLWRDDIGKPDAWGKYL